MKTEILKQKDNQLLGRKELWISVEHIGKATPSRVDILSEIAKIVKSKKECVIVEKIFTQTGKGVSKVKVFIYSKKGDIPKEKVEKMKRRMKIGGKGEKKEVSNNGQRTKGANK